jgi:RNA 3'-terminal phosphate cyclase (ATP)
MASAQRTVEIDGGQFREGGAIIRTALVMSSLTNQGLVIQNVRGSERKPGIHFEDEVLIRALADICHAKVLHAEFGSDTFSFFPSQRPRAGRVNVSLYNSHKTGDHESASDMMYALWMVLARSGAYSQIQVEADTFSNKNTSYPILEQGIAVLNKRQGLYAYPRLTEANFSAHSKGSLVMDVEPSGPHALQWTKRGKLQELRCVFWATEPEQSIIRKFIERIPLIINKDNLRFNVEAIPVESHEKGIGMSLSGYFEHGVGAINQSASRYTDLDRLAQDCKSEFSEWFESEATLSPNIAPYALIPAFLSSEETIFTTSKITERLQAVAWVIKQFAPIKITVSGKLGEFGQITIRY